MNKQEYGYLQKLLTQKLIQKLKGSKGYMTNKEECYNNRVLSCKSSLSKYYNSDLNKSK